MRVSTCFNCTFRLFILAALGLLVAWLVVDTRHRPEQLISFGGVCILVVLIFLLSAHRSAVSFTISHWMAFLIAVPTTVSKDPRVILSRDLSLMSYAETMDNIWPFEPHLLRNNQKRFLTPTCGVMETPWFKSSANTFSSSFVFRWCGGQCSGVWACSSALAFLSSEHIPGLLPSNGLEIKWRYLNTGLSKCQLSLGGPLCVINKHTCLHLDNASRNMQICLNLTLIHNVISLTYTHIYFCTYI